jgi:uncharacterized protein YdeI (YjbR/CyaY-like superfamily)
VGNPLEISTVYVKDRAAWREWLSKHHDSEPAGIWLVYYKKHTGKPTLEYGESVEEALCFGWVDSLIRKLDADRFARKFTPRKPGSRWSPSNRERAEKLIEQGLMTGHGMGLVEAAKESGTWDADDRPQLSDEPAPGFQRALAGNHAARMFFDKLTDRQRLQYIYWINEAKQDATRQRRVRESISLLEQGRKLGMK